MKNTITLIALSAMMAGAMAKCPVIEFAELQSMDKAEITAVYCGYSKTLDAALASSKANLKAAHESKTAEAFDFARAADITIAEAQACMVETRRISGAMRRAKFEVPDPCGKTQ